MLVVTNHGIPPETVLEREGVRVVVMDSVAFASLENAGDVIVTGSHGGTSAGEYAERFGVAAIVCNDAGFGKADAGIAGLAAVELAGIAGIAVGHTSARIGDGKDVWDNGIVTFANGLAAGAGVRVGQLVKDQVSALLPRLTSKEEAGSGMRRTVVLERPRCRVVLLDSMSQAEDADRGHVVVAASNGGKESGRIAVLTRCACAVFNDAGVGKDAAGIAGLTAMDEAGIPGLTVSHTSAIISDGQDTWENGVISHINGAAAAAGFRTCVRVKDAVARFLDERQA